jgi:hypothetical protein
MPSVPKDVWQTEEELIVLTEANRSLAAYFAAYLILGGSFYGLVIYPYVLDDLVKGFLISIAMLAGNWIFQKSTTDDTARQQQAATAAGAAAGAMVPSTTTTVTEGPPMKVTTGPTPNGLVAEEEEDLP